MQISIWLYVNVYVLLGFCQLRNISTALKHVQRDNGLVDRYTDYSLMGCDMHRTVGLALAQW